jgi:hypothetical protein
VILYTIFKEYNIRRTFKDLYCYGPGDTNGISNKTVITRPWQTGQWNGTSETMGWGVAELYS